MLGWMLCAGSAGDLWLKSTSLYSLCPLQKNLKAVQKFEIWNSKKGFYLSGFLLWPGECDRV